MKHNGSYLRQYLPWLGLLLGVDALAACCSGWRTRGPSPPWRP
ncbi:MAG: hypothetical protein ACLUMN_04415 [Oscillospiraceae bacterium]